MGDYKVSSPSLTKTTTLGSFSIDIIQLVLFSSVMMNVSFFDDNYNFFDSVNLNLTTNGNCAHVYDTTDNVTYNATKTATSAASAASVASVNAASAALKTDAATDAATALTTASDALTDAATALTTASDALTDATALTAAAAALTAAAAASDAAVNAGSVNAASALNTASIALNTASVALNTTLIVKAAEYNYTKWGQNIATTDNSKTDGYIIKFVTDYIEQVYLKPT